MKERRSVDIVTARVHDTVDLRFVVDILRVSYRPVIKVGTTWDSPCRFAACERCDDTPSIDSRPNVRNTYILIDLASLFRRILRMVAELDVHVHVPSDRHHIIEFYFQCFE